MSARALRLATRGSKLAMTQSSQIAKLLQAHTGIAVELVQIKTEGDLNNHSLAQLGGTGVFVTAVREALTNGHCDFAVHSLKDLPTASHPGLEQFIPKRHDVRDALCVRGHRKLAALPAGARIGTGSPRRRAQLLFLRPDLEVLDIRGNIDTRLARINNDLDAVVLAVAGLKRAGLGDHITEVFQPEQMLNAPGQGALALEATTATLATNPALAAALHALNDPQTQFATVAERTILQVMEAGCAAPVGAFGSFADDTFTLLGRALSLDGQSCVNASGQLRETKVSDLAAASEIGKDVAQKILLQQDVLDPEPLN